MKKIFIILFFSAFLLSCGDDNNEEVFQNASIELSKDALTFDYNGAGEIASVKVTSSQDWRLTGRQDWATPSVEKGKTGESVTFMLAPNNDETLREVDFIFFCGNASHKLTIVQNPQSYLEEIWDGGSDFSFNISGGYITKAIKSNMPLVYEISNNEDEWVKLSNVASDTPEKWYQFYVTPNEGFAKRNATITLFKGTDYEEILTIQQETQTDILIEKDLWELELEAGVITIKVRSNIDYNVSIDSKSTWLTKTDESSPADTEIPGLKEKTYTFSYTKAMGTRSANISVSGMGINKSLNIRQINPNPIFVEIPDSYFRSYLVNEGFLISNKEQYELSVYQQFKVEDTFSGIRQQLCCVVR